MAGSVAFSPGRSWERSREGVPSRPRKSRPPFTRVLPLSSGPCLCRFSSSWSDRYHTDPRRRPGGQPLLLPPRQPFLQGAVCPDLMSPNLPAMGTRANRHQLDPSMSWTRPQDRPSHQGGLERPPRQDSLASWDAGRLAIRERHGPVPEPPASGQRAAGTGALAAPIPRPCALPASSP